MADTLAQVLSNHKDTSKKLDEQSSLLGQILKVQQDQYKLEQKEAKQAARDRAAAKRSRSDKGLAGVMGGGKDNEKIKGGDFLKNLLKGLGGLFNIKGSLGLVGGLGGFLLKALGIKAGFSLLDALMDRLFPGSKKGQGIMSRIMQRLFGRGKVGQKGIFPSMIDNINRSLFGRGKVGAKGMFPKLFDKLSKSMSGLFGKGGKLGGLGKLFSGKNLIKGGGIIAAITSSIQEFFSTGSFTDALFAGGELVLVLLVEAF